MIIINQCNYIQILAKAFSSDDQLLYYICLIILVGVLSLSLVRKNSVYIFKNFLKKFSSSFAFFSSLLNTYAAQSWKVPETCSTTKLSTNEDSKVRW